MGTWETRVLWSPLAHQSVLRRCLAGRSRLRCDCEEDVQISPMSLAWYARFAVPPGARADFVPMSSRALALALRMQTGCTDFASVVGLVYRSHGTVILKSKVSDG